MSDGAFQEFLTDAFSACNDVMKAGCPFYIWHADSEGYNFRTAVKRATWQLREVLIWVKNSFTLGRQDYQWQHEPCLYGWKDGAAHYFVDDRTQSTIQEDIVNVDKLKKEEMREMLKELLSEKVATTIIRENKPSRSSEHPTMKPVRLIGRLIRNSSRRGEKVLDIFGGSGTTLIACEQLDRECYMMELDPHYCDVIIARWEKFTGNTATKIQEAPAQ